MTPKQKLTALRAQMRDNSIDAYLIPSTDPHQSEYVPSCWERRTWISGFTGSAGEVLVTEKTAGLWTDGRYFQQAAAELHGSGIKLFRSKNPGVPTMEEFLAKTFAKGGKVGLDPRTVSMSRARSLAKTLGNHGLDLAKTATNLVDEAWEDRPAMSSAPVQVLDKKFTGETATSKIRRLRAEMKKAGAAHHVVTTLDAIAWLFNVRGADVEFNPVVISYAIITADKAEWFVDSSKLDDAARKKLDKAVTVRPYEDFERTVSSLASAGERVWVEGSSVNQHVVDLLDGADLHTALSPIAMMKAKKNDVEIAGMRAAHIRDGVAVVRFLKWLSEAIPGGSGGDVTEISAADQLEAFRREGELFQGLAFRTISGYGEHGAIIHYTVTPKTNVKLEPQGIYLLDSGAQYLDGTTDITRTILLGRRGTKEQKDRYTLVLKGHISLARAKFPQGVTGVRLDTLARQWLWGAGLDYNHGTGHGVGAFLAVHEGPRSIGPASPNTLPIEPGNVFSNEPGYYKEGEYGIRIENLIVTVDSGDVSDSGVPFYKFEDLTVCPIDTRLINPNLLDAGEIRWLNAYHRHVYKTLSPFLEKEDRSWLKTACAGV